MATRIPTGVRNAVADAVVDRLDAGAGAGVVELRTGAQPASANDAATGTLLATVTLADPAFGAAAAGTATLLGVPLEDVADADGNAGWFRAKDSDGATVVDGSVTATGGGGDMTMASVALVTGVVFRITGWTVTAPAG
jgi:hypothetical protein